MMYKVFDDVLPTSMQEHLELTFKDPNMVWMWQDNTSGFQDWELAFIANNPEIKESPQFVHTVLDPTKQITCYTWEMVKPIFYFLEKETGMQIKTIERVKSNLMMADGSDPTKVYNPPHIDSPHDESLSMIYYLHDCDGATRLFKNSLKQGMGNLEVETTVEPKRGRMFVFPSNRFHASSNPSSANPRRMIVNFVFTPQKPLW